MYRFSLENVLKSRKIQEKVRQAEFSRFVQKRLIITGEIERLESEIESTIKAMENHKLKGIFGLYEFRNLRELRDKLKDQLAQAYQTLSDFDVIFEQERQKTIEAVKKRKIMETLNEKEYEQYVQELKRKEQSFFDEINSARFRIFKNGDAFTEE